MIFIRKYLETLWSILRTPSQFFKKMPIGGGLAAPLTFALATHWMGTLGAYLWRMLLGTDSVLQSWWRSRMENVDVDTIDDYSWMADNLNQWSKDFFWSAGSVVLDPFKTLLSILATSLFVFIGARLLVSPGKHGAPWEIRYESAVRIMAYSTAPSILLALPMGGEFLAWIGGLILSVIGAREVYRVDTGRALTIAFFPQILVFGVVALAIGAGAFALINLIIFN